jgi:hypothetical protein
VKRKILTCHESNPSLSVHSLVIVLFVVSVAHTIQDVPQRDVHSENTCFWGYFGSKFSKKHISYSKPFQSYMQLEERIV